MNNEDIQKALEALGKGGINIAGDLVLEKQVEYEVNNVEAGGVGIQIVNEKEESKKGISQLHSVDKRQQEVIDKLKPIFFGQEENAKDFLLSIQGMKPILITQKVNQLVKERIISELSCKRELWKVLHDNDLYTPSESNWNQQVK